ncbi:hypothetical protein BaRGS_00000468 [Batillaria attramentaria]|uniref:DNA-directed RNA polymerase III subunit RPC9 n=1 Tax=Batillaria attramentaria TaxID=370345 RepID=A0ABD0M8T3_9CAEN|nr:hypothetical protein BaRGS_020329 [Batillaria attramentaria]
MEVINENAGLLSNLEVFMLLKDIQAGRGNQQKPNKHQQNLATVTYETVKYLERTPCALQSPENVSAFMEAMKDFNLTKAEKLQLLNQRPSSAVEIQLLVEESEERLTEEEVYQLLSVIATHLPGPEPDTMPQAEEQSEEVELEREEVEECDDSYVAI